MALTPEEIIAPELLPGEQVRWLGMSSVRAVLPSGLARMAFGLAFAVGPHVSTEPLIGEQAILVWLIFPCAGLSIFRSGLVIALTARRTAFAVTDRRVLSVRQFLGRKVHSLPPGAINVLDYHAKSDGSGTIVFRSVEASTGEGPGAEKTGFHGVKDVAGAHLALLRLRSPAATNPWGR